MKRVFILAILIVSAVSLNSFKKEKPAEKQVEIAPFTEIDWRMNYYFYHSDSTWVDAPFPDWKLKFNKDKSFVLDLGNNLCTGKYDWQYTSINSILKLQFHIDSWNNPPGMNEEGNKIKEMIESAFDCYLYIPAAHITIHSVKGTIDAQTL